MNQPCTFQSISLSFCQNRNKLHLVNFNWWCSETAIIIKFSFMLYQYFLWAYCIVWKQPAILRLRTIIRFKFLLKLKRNKATYSTIFLRNPVIFFLMCVTQGLRQSKCLTFISSEVLLGVGWKKPHSTENPWKTWMLFSAQDLYGQLK